MSLRPNEILIGPHNAHLFTSDQQVDGEHKARGLIPRNYKTHPVGHYPWATAVDFPLIPRSEWEARAAEKTSRRAWLSDIRLKGNNGQPVPSRDQNGRGYCWRHSPTSCNLLLRAFAGLPYADLSAYAGACMIKAFRDEGGWGAQGVDDVIRRGDPTSEFWPQRSVDRANDNPRTWENAALHRIIDQWADLNQAEYDRGLTFDQVGTLLLSDVPVVGDFNWWSHSVCLMDLVNGSGQFGVFRADSGKLATAAEFEEAWAVNDPVTAGWGVRLWNSWGDSWSDRGMGTLTGSKAVPDGAVAPRTTTLSAA